MEYCLSLTTKQPLSYIGYKQQQSKLCAIIFLETEWRKSIKTFAVLLLISHEIVLSECICWQKINILLLESIKDKNKTINDAILYVWDLTRHLLYRKIAF